MFGRVKALVWVPEFRRGNPELGTVKQSFTVQASFEPGPGWIMSFSELPGSDDEAQSLRPVLT